MPALVWIFRKSQRGLTREGAAFDDRFTQTGDAGVGVDLQEEPSRLDKERLQLRDLKLFFRRNRGVIAFLLREGVGRREDSAHARAGKDTGDCGPSVHLDL